MKSDYIDPGPAKFKKGDYVKVIPYRGVGKVIARGLSFRVWTYTIEGWESSVITQGELRKVSVKDYSKLL